MTDDNVGAYVGATGPDGRQQLWWAPPDGFPRDALPALSERSADGPNWGYGGNGPADAAKAILLHATADGAAAEEHHRDFVHDFLASTDPARPFCIPIADVATWAEERNLHLAPGWTRHGPGPVVNREVTSASTDRYVVGLDGHPILDIELPPPTTDGVVDARVGIRDRREIGGYSWDDVVQVATAEDDTPAAETETRVTSEPLPFGGWAVQVDGYDVVILERTGERNDGTRVAVYDRAPGADFLATEKIVRHQAATKPPAVAERLRTFAVTEPRAALAR